MTRKKTTTRPSPDRLAKTDASGVQLSEAQLAQVNGGLNYTKIMFKN